MAAVFGALLKSEREARKSAEKQCLDSRDYNKELVEKLFIANEKMTTALTEAQVAVSQGTMIIHDAQEADRRRQP